MTPSKPRQPHLNLGRALGRRLAAGFVFCEGTGERVYDSSGWGNAGVLVNGPTWLSGRCGPVVDFDGSDDRIDLDRPIVLADDTPWTIAMGVLPDVLDTDGLYGYDFTTGKYTLCYYTAAPSFRIRNNANTEIVWYPSGFVAGQWYDVLLACDGGNVANVELWVNGVSQGTKTLADSSQTITRLATYGGTGSNRGIDGKMDYFLVWSGLRLSPRDLLDPLAMFRPRRRRTWSKSPAVGGPYRVVGSQAWQAGAIAGNVSVAGLEAGEVCNSI